MPSTPQSLQALACDHHDGDGDDNNGNGDGDGEPESLHAGTCL